MLISYFFKHLLDIRVSFTTRVYCSYQIFFSKIEHKNLLSVPLIEISQFLIKLQIIGDIAFPNQNWIIKPYRNNAVLTPTERRFNAKHCGVICAL